VAAWRLIIARGAITLSFLVLLQLATGCTRIAPPKKAPASQQDSRTASEEGTSQDFDQIAEGLRLIPVPEKTTGLRFPEVFDETLKEPDLRTVAEANAFAKWKKHEDESVTFEYPEDPRITLEVMGPEKGFRVTGGRVGTTENTWFRNYLLKLGGTSYCAMMLDRKADFDDGVCFCGAVVLEKYLFHNGALFRFSLLKDGQVKKVQVLCNGLRLEFFEWTHMPIHQDVYVRIALSVRMKNGPCDESKMRERVLAKYGAEGRLGFLELGMSKEDVLRLLGKPTQEDHERLIFTSLDGRWETTARIDLPSGVFRGLGEGWRSLRQLPPKRGTPRWIGEMAGRWFGDDYELGERTKDDVQYMFNRFVELGPTARGSDWVYLCGGMDALCQDGEKDPRVYRIVASRLFDTTLRQSDAAEFLHRYDPNGSQPLFVKLVKLIYEEARTPPKPESRPDGWLAASDALWYIYEFIGEDAPEYPGIVFTGMNHPADVVRYQAFRQWQSKLPSTEVLAFLRKGISDKSWEVRQESARAFLEEYGEEEDITLLQDRLKKEKEVLIRQDIEKAIERLKRIYVKD